MRKHWPVLLAALAIAIPTLATAQEATQAGAPKAASVEAAVGTAVADRQLTGMAESFPSSSGTLYCYMKISNAANTEVQHVWYKGDTEMSRVTLKIGADSWRTWSTKKLPTDAAGDWRCDIVQGEKVLQSVKFKVE